MLAKLNTLLEMIKFKHTVFAMPFGLMGVVLAARGLPDWRTVFWVVLAMVGARTCAMTFNRIADRKFDAANPRTASRALPTGAVSLQESWVMVVAGGVLFFMACAMLNRLTLYLAPFILGLTLFYSLTKRFTWFCHIILGLALSLAPTGGWVAVTGTLGGYPWVLSLGVLFWVSGFDAIYACLDADFDRKFGLYSMPAVLGRQRTFRVAVAFHLLAFILFTITGIQMGLNVFYFIGILITGAALFYQHLVITPRDLTKIQLSFFTMNGIISLTLFLATCLSLLISG
jgi:4-hydroxybenzoate polyprenyltransferase